MHGEGPHWRTAKKSRSRSGQDLHTLPISCPLNLFGSHWGRNFTHEALCYPRLFLGQSMASTSLHAALGNILAAGKMHEKSSARSSTGLRALSALHCASRTLQGHESSLLRDEATPGSSCLSGEPDVVNCTWLDAFWAMRNWG